MDDNYANPIASIGKKKKGHQYSQLDILSRIHKTGLDMQ